MTYCPLGNFCPEDPCPNRMDCINAVLEDVEQEKEPEAPINTEEFEQQQHDEK